MSTMEDGTRVHKLDFLNLTEVEPLARAILPKMVYEYYSGGSETMSSVENNREVFSRIQLVPRMLRDVSKISTGTNIWGMDMRFPVMVAPMAMHGMAHADRELGTSRAASRAGIPFVFSTMATSSLEELAPTGKNLIFQLYVIRNRDIVKAWVQQAEALGFKALMVTVDAPRLAKREADERNRFTLPPGLQLKNLAPLQALETAAANAHAVQAEAAGAEAVQSAASALALDAAGRTADAAAAAAAAHGSAAASDEHAQGALSAAVAEKASNARDNSEGSGLMKLFACQIDDSLTWDIIPWLRTLTTLPIIVKGILAPEDARLAVEHGVDGIVVSNHGGRQLDYSPSALEMLPSVLQAVGGRIPVLVDGGIRRGTDVIKALAMGASGVLLGRPVLYGLAVGGEEGVLRVLELLRAEFELAMALSGCCSVSDINRGMLRLPLEMTR